MNLLAACLSDAPILFSLAVVFVSGACTATATFMLIGRHRALREVRQLANRQRR